MEVGENSLTLIPRARFASEDAAFFTPLQTARQILRGHARPPVLSICVVRERRPMRTVPPQSTSIADAGLGIVATSKPIKIQRAEIHSHPVAAVKIERRAAVESNCPVSSAKGSVEPGETHRLEAGVRARHICPSKTARPAGSP